MRILQRAGDDLLIRIEARVDGIHRYKGGKHRSARTCGYEVARGHFKAAHTSGDRRTDLRVAEVELGGLQGRLRRAHVGRRLAPCAHALVQLALGDGALLPQALRAVELARSVVQARLRGEELGVRAVGLGRVRGSGSIVTRRSPAFTSAPSLKWMACTAPATRERTSTRSTASRRPENSSHVCDLGRLHGGDTSDGGGLRRGRAPAAPDARWAAIPPAGQRGRARLQQRWLQGRRAGTAMAEGLLRVRVTDEQTFEADVS